jgi:ankyrin repeat protein
MKSLETIVDDSASVLTGSSDSPGSPGSPDAKTRVDPAENVAAGFQETIREGTSFEEGHSRYAFPGSEFRGWALEGPLSAMGGEADLFVVSREGARRVLKLFRFGVRPREEIAAKLLAATAAAPELFVRVLEAGFDEKTQRSFEIQEFCEAGSLHELLKQGPLPDEQARSLLEQACRALNLLHFQGILHLDIKPENILVKSVSPFRAVLADFGMASTLQDEFSKKATEVRGSFLYQPPESLAGIVGAKTDWWGLGIVLLETLAGKHPLGGRKVHEAVFHISSKDIPLSAGLSPFWEQLLKGLLTRDADKRWGPNEVAAWQSGTFVPHYYGGTGADGHYLRHLQAHPRGWARFMRPFSWKGVPFETWEDLLERFSRDSQAWKESTEAIRNGEFLRLLSDALPRDVLPRVQVRISVAELPDIILFALLNEYRPDIPMAWKGLLLGLEELRELVRRVAEQQGNDIDQRFLEQAFRGRLKAILPKRTHVAEESLMAIFAVAAQFSGSPLENLTLPTKARLLSRLIAGAPPFRALHDVCPLQVALEWAGTDSAVSELAVVSQIPGFARWGFDQNWFTAEQELLWEFLCLAPPEKIGEPRGKILEFLLAQKTELIRFVLSDPGALKMLTRIIGREAPSPDTWTLFESSRAQHSWLPDLIGVLFQRQFHQDDPAANQSLCGRLLVFEEIRGHAGEYRNRLLPPFMEKALACADGFQYTDDRWKLFLIEHPLDSWCFAELSPAVFPLKGSLGAQDWPGVREVLSREGIEVTDLRHIGRVFRILEERERFLTCGWSIKEMLSLNGLIVSGLLLFLGWGTMPAILAFLGAGWWIRQGWQWEALDWERQLESARAALPPGESEVLGNESQKARQCQDWTRRTNVVGAVLLAFGLAYNLWFSSAAGSSVPKKPEQPPAGPMRELHTSSTAFLKTRQYLEQAFEANSREMVELSINSGASPNSVMAQRNAPLHLATRRNWASTVQLLLQKGADPRLVNEAQQTPLLMAVQGETPELVSLLLEKIDGAWDPNYLNQILLSEVLERGNPPIVEAFVRKGARLLFQDRGKAVRTLLNSRTLNPPALVKLVFLDGEEIAEHKMVVTDLLFHEIAKGRTAEARGLLEAIPALMTMTDIDGDTALHYAAGFGRDQLVAFLLQQPGVSPLSENETGQSPFKLAQRSAFSGCMNLLQSFQPVETGTGSAILALGAASLRQNQPVQHFRVQDERVLCSDVYKPWIGSVRIRTTMAEWEKRRKNRDP